MDKPFTAYAGDEPYVFVCYAHEDAHRVYPEILRLQEAGGRLWYDEGISPGTRWSDELARALAGASAVLFFSTPASVASQHCQDEISFALDDQLPILTVQFEELELPPGLRLRLGAQQAIHAYEMDRQQFHAKLDAALATWMDPTSRASERLPGRSEVAPAASRRWWLAGVFAAAVSLVAGTWWWTRPVDLGVDDPNFLSVAVLPFRAGGDQQSELLAAGISETLANALAGEPLERFRAIYPAYRGGVLKVTPYLSSLRYAGSTLDPALIAEELGVRFLISGTVRVSGREKARVTAELMDATSNEQLWSASNTYAIGEAELESDIALSIGRSVIPTMPASRWWSRVKSGVGADAYEHYVLAQTLQLLDGSPTRFAEIAANFERAKQLEPWVYSFHQHLLDAYLQQMWFRLDEVPTIAPIPLMIEQLKADFADDTFSGRERHDSTVATMKARYAYLQLDFARAEALAQEVLRLEPNSVWAYLLLSSLAAHRGDLDEALRKAQRAYDAGAVFSIAIEGIARRHLLRGRPRAAVEIIDEVLQLMANDYGRGRLLIVRAEALLELDEREAALEDLERGHRLLEASHPAASAAVLVRSGSTDRARKLLELARKGDVGDAVNVLDVLLGYAALEEREEVVYWTRRVLDARHAPSLATLQMHVTGAGSSASSAWLAVGQELAQLPSKVH